MCSSFREHVGIPSGPVALWGLRLSMSLATPPTETDIWDISGNSESSLWSVCLSENLQQKLLL